MGYTNDELIVIFERTDGCCHLCFEVAAALGRPARSPAACRRGRASAGDASAAGGREHGEPLRRLDSQAGIESWDTVAALGDDDSIASCTRSQRHRRRRCDPGPIRRRSTSSCGNMASRCGCCMRSTCRHSQTGRQR